MRRNDETGRAASDGLLTGGRSAPVRRPCPARRSAALWILLLLFLPSAARPREVPVTVLFTADLHGRLTAREAGEGGGLLAIAERIRRIREGGGPVIVLDCGDTLQGTWEGFHSRGRWILEAMEAAGYDAWIPGNHEFDWGVSALRPLVREAPFAVLAANLSALPGREHPLPGIRPFLLHVADGVRVAVVGLTHPSIPLWTLPGDLEGLRVERAMPALERVWPELRRARPDVVILAAHMGLGEGPAGSGCELSAVARAFPELDLIVGGHSHREEEGRRIGGALYVQAGSHGNRLGRVTLIYDTVQRRVTHREAELLRVESGDPVHPELEERMARRLEQARRALDRRVGRAVEPLCVSGSDPVGGGLGEWIRAAILEETGADWVLYGAPLPGGLAAGPVMERDLWRILPYENRIGIARLTPGEMRLLLEENLAQEPSRVMGFRGAWAETDASGRRVLRLRAPDGSALHPRRRYLVAFGSYHLASGGGRWPELRRISRQPEARLDWAEGDVRDHVRSAFRSRGPARRPPPLGGVRPCPRE